MDDLPPRDPEHPYWCQRDHGCVLEYGHDGRCDITGAILGLDDYCGKCTRCRGGNSDTRE